MTIGVVNVWYLSEFIRIKVNHRDSEKLIAIPNIQLMEMNK